MSDQFTEFLEKKFFENHADGVIKDNAETAVDNWISDLDADELKKYEEEFNQLNKN